MMDKNRKTISSREETPSDDRLRDRLIEFVLVLDAALDCSEDPEDDVQRLMDQVQDGILTLIEEHEQAKQDAMGFLHDVVALTHENMSLRQELQRLVFVLHALSQPPFDDEVIDKALKVLRHDGQAEVSIAPVDEQTSDLAPDLTVNITFEEDNLREGLITAINEYISEVAQKALRAI
jgi:hypothetical protein